MKMELMSEMYPVVFDSIPEHIAVVNANGRIEAVNQAWKNYTRQNGGLPADTGVGKNYLRICDASAQAGIDDAGSAYGGIKDVLQGHASRFNLEYPCHRPHEQQWFFLKCWPFAWKNGSYAVISHQDVTEEVLLREEFRSQAITDPVTGLANRRHFDSTLALEWRRDWRDSQPLSLIMLDIDMFKQFNDFYGHAAGDDCLRKISRTMELFARRPGDLVARYGGEEFMLLLARTTEQAATQIAQNLCQAVRELGIEHRTSSVSHVVTASLGVTTMIPSRDVSTNDLLLSADRALYSAKSNGRNMVASAV